MPKSPKEMGEAIARNLPAKTGRTFKQWVDPVKRAGLATRPERVEWLKSKHQLGPVTASFIAAEAEGRSLIDWKQEAARRRPPPRSGEPARSTRRAIVHREAGRPHRRQRPPAYRR